MDKCSYSKPAKSNLPPALVRGQEARTQKGFKANVEREEMLGRPEKQAVKVAYKEADDAITESRARKIKKDTKKYA